MTNDEVQAAVTTFLETLGFGMNQVASVSITPGLIDVVLVERHDDPGKAVTTTHTTIKWIPS
jgi:hypothetical protein